MNKYSAEGFLIDSVVYEIKIKFFVCDTPARSFIKATVGHTSKNGCERCYAEGSKVDGVMTFTSLDSTKRTMIDFLKFEDPAYHIGVSPLIFLKPTLNLIDSFVLDPMHLIYLGCMKRLMEYWIDKPNSKLSQLLINELARRSELLKFDCCQEFPRKMRSTKFYSIYKAVEFVFFLKYCGPIILKGILSDEKYNNFLKLHYVCRLFSGKNFVTHIEECRIHLKNFVKEAQEIYKDSFITINIHNLIHISDDIENMNCNLNELSAFQFESSLSKIKSLIRSPNHIPAQICRRFYENEALN